MIEQTTLPAARRRRSVLGWLFRAVFLWPFKVAWRFASRVEHRAGIGATLIAGAVLTLAGLWFSSMFLLIPVGVPMVLVGLLLLLRALY